MEHRPLVLANGLLGLGLLATAVAAMLYTSRLPTDPTAPPPPGWAALELLTGQARASAGVDFRVTAVRVGDRVMPGVRAAALAHALDAVVFELEVRNSRDEPSALTPWMFGLATADRLAAVLCHSEGFAPPTLRPGEARAVAVGFRAPPTAFPCRLAIAGETLRGDRTYDVRFDGGGR
jgi:hypothetical protein